MLAVVTLGIATPLCENAVGEAWLVRAAQGAALIVLIYSVAGSFHQEHHDRPVPEMGRHPARAALHRRLLDDITVYLDSVSFEVGNIRVSLYAVLRTLLFGVILFWLGRASNATGTAGDPHPGECSTPAPARSVAKLFEIGVYVLIFLLLINVMGIDLTALAVFGGALGVGLGFGLQQIASNFISGIIILLDRSITIGDYIELEDGRAGTLRELTMRSATLETFDGKDIMVPNERFITTAFVNWTHNNNKQRYSLHFQVAYDTDLESDVRDRPRDRQRAIPRCSAATTCRSPNGPTPRSKASAIPASISWSNSGWRAIDDGDNRVGADLLLMIWTALKANGIEIPFPQREVKILDKAKTD